MRRAFLALAALLVVAPAIPGAQGPVARSGWDVFHLWRDAIEQHSAGENDAAVVMMLGVNAQELEAVFPHMTHVLARAIAAKHRRPDFDETFQPFFRKEPSRADLVRMQIAVDRLGAFGVTRFLKRAALLHADIALVKIDAHTSRRAGVGHLASDGRNAGDEERTWHWMLGRAFLHILPILRADPEARLWYQSVANHLWATRNFTELMPHLKRALEIFPDDAELWFVKGLAHESQSGPHIQAAVAARVDEARPSGPAWSSYVPSVRPAPGERREAREAFRNALALEPAHVEARIRRGRLLSLNGELDAAVRELASALDRPLDRRLEYFARLFLGRAHELAGRATDARAAYEAAAALYPDAQSPVLSLSQLSLLAGDRAGAAAVFDSLSRDVSRTAEPWWTYHFERVPHREAWVRRMWDAFGEAVK